MTNMVFSLYRLFFIDENDKIWVVLKDGRICFVKNGVSFCGFSSDRRGILGVSFHHDETAVLALDLRFSQMTPYLLCQVKGYIYYPALLVQKKLRLAYLEADLLSSNGCGRLIVLDRARKRFKSVFQTMARITPIVFHETSGDLFYIDDKATLRRLSKNTFESVVVAKDVKAFALHEVREYCAVLKQDVVFVFNNSGVIIASFNVSGVIAISFSETGEEVYVALDDKGRYGIYGYNLKTRMLLPIASHACRVIGLCR